MLYFDFCKELLGHDTRGRSDDTQDSYVKTPSVFNLLQPCPNTQPLAAIKNIHKREKQPPKARRNAWPNSSGAFG